MGFNLNSVKKGKERKPRKLIIYGSPKLGKSTLAGSTKNALLIPTEDRVSHIDCDKTNVVTSIKDIQEIFESLLEEKNTYKRIIIDTIDWLEPLIHAQVCEKNGWKSLTEDANKETNFSKGLKYHAVNGWRNFLDNCDYMRDNGFDIIFVSHSQMITIKPASKDDYDKEVMKIDKNALSVVEEWADLIGNYARDYIVTKEEKAKKGKIKSLNRRMLYLSGDNMSIVSGNSFNLPDIEVDLDHCQEIMEWLLTADGE